MDELASLRPVQKRRVFDLLKEAGLDVSDWADFSRGAKWAAANPKYCYNWAFVQSGRIVVLNLWYRQLHVGRRWISWSNNLRDWIQRHSKAIWRKRAEEFAEAIAEASRSQLPIRVIVNDGIMRGASERASKPSSVQRRLLDPLPWSVTAYNQSTGECVLTRGILIKGTVDQFDLAGDGRTAPETIVTVTSSFVRDPTFRAAALARANGRCEFCSEPGFTMADGRVFLETHHVVPLSEGGSDSPRNIAAVCPNHHREAHHGARATEIREALLRRAGQRSNAV